MRPDNDRRLFGRVRRSPSGDVCTVWSEDQLPNNLGRGSNPHASYHKNGRLHSKSYDRKMIIKKLQPPDRGFMGNQQIEATNADRGTSAKLHLFPQHPDDGVRYNSVKSKDTPIDA